MYLMYDAQKQEFIRLDENEFNSTLGMMQYCVDGRIEHASDLFPYEDIDVFCNESGWLIEGLPLCSYHEIGDECVPVLLRGNLVFARSDDEGCTIPLKESDVERIVKSFWKERWVFSLDDKILNLPVFIQ